MELIDMITPKENLNSAYKKVVANKGAGGVDGMKVEEFGVYIKEIKQYANPTELTAELLNALIEKILVHEATIDEEGNRVQEVEIFYRFIGKSSKSYFLAINIFN